MKKGEYVSMRTLKQTLPYLTVSLTILYAFMRIYKSYNPFAFPGIEERISLILVPCIILTLIFYFPFQKVEKQIKAMSDRLRKFPFQRIEKQLKPITDRLREKVQKPTFIQKIACRKIISSENYQKALIKYLFLVLLAIIAVLEIEPVSKYLSFLVEFKTHLLVMVIVFGVVTFWQNREVIKEVEVEASEEQKQEQKRKEEFLKKYPRINKIPVFRNIVRWMYKEGWGYSIALVLIVLVGFGLRLWNLGYLGLWGDEGTVYIASKNILSEGIPLLETGLLYSRDYPHLYLTALSLEIFGHTEFALRIPSVVFGTLLIILTYLLTIEIFEDKPTAIFAAGIIATHPWLIEYSRFARSYIMMVCLLYTSIYFYSIALRSEKSENLHLAIFSVLGFFTALTHQIGQVVIFLFPLAIHKFIKKNDFYKYLASFSIIAFGIGIYRYVSSKGYLTYTDQYLAKYPMGVHSLAERIPFGSADFSNLDVIFAGAPIFWFMSLMGVIVLINKCVMHTEKRDRYLFPVAIFTIFLLTLIFSERAVTVNRVVLFLSPIMVILVSFTVRFIVTKYLKHIPNKKTNNLDGGVYMVSVLIVMVVFAQISYFTIVERDYGDPINPNYSLFEGFVFYPDHKTTTEYVNEHYKDRDIIIVYQVPQYWVFYGNRLPDYRVWTGTTYTINGKNVYTGVKEVQDLDKLKEILESNDRVWIVTSYSARRSYRIYHISKSFIKYLDNFEKNIVYVSKDTTARVYLIENKTSNVSDIKTD